MKIKKVLLGVVAFAFLGAMSVTQVKAEWVNPNGTARGYSTSFNYLVESNYNKYSLGNGTVDEVADAKKDGKEFAEYSDGQVWICKDYSSIVKVSNADYSKKPITSVTVSDTSVATVSLKDGNPKSTNVRYSLKGVSNGTTTLTVKRSDGTSFAVPINVVPQVQITNDEGTNNKNVAMGLGTGIQPAIVISNSNSLLTNKVLHYKWSSDNASIVAITNGKMLFAKTKGATIGRCNVYDKVSCFNKYHYADSYTKREVIYSIKVMEETPVIQLTDSNGNSLNQKVVEKEVGQQILLNAQLKEVGTVTWKFYSSDPKVAIVDELGRVTAIGLGTTTIKVKGAELEQSFTLSVVKASDETVNELQKIKIAIPGNKVQVGKSVDMLKNYSTVPAKTKVYSFNIISSNSNIIEVKNNMIIPKRIGKCTLIISATDYKSNIVTARAEITVGLSTPKISFIKKTLTIKKKSKKTKKVYNVINIKKVPSAKTYIIYRASSTNGKFTEIGRTNSLSFVDTKSKATKSYVYKVVATTGEKAYDSAYSASLVVSGIKKPKVKKIKKVGDGLKFTLKGSADSYELYYGTTKKCKKRVGVSTKKVFMIKFNPVKGKKYYFKVRGIKKIGNVTIKSAFSKVKVYKK